MSLSHLLFRRRSRPFAAAVPLLLVTCAVAACGSEDEQKTASPSSGPATLAPANAIAYGEVLVRPEGDVEEGVLTAARRMLRVADPARELRRLLDEATDEGDRNVFSAEIDPFLGDRVGGFLLIENPADAESPDGAGIIEVRDQAAAERALARDAGTDDRRATYEGVEYTIDGDDDVVYGFVDDYLVAGTEEGFRAAVAASKGRSLAEEERFTDAADELPDDRLAWGYAEPRMIIELLREQALVDPELRGALEGQEEQLDRALGSEPITMALTARADQVVFEFASGSAELPQAGDSAVALGDLPGEAWAAFAAPVDGETIARQLRQSDVYDMAATQVRELLGLDLDADLLGWLDGVAAFVGGTSLVDASAGIVLGSSDPAGTERAVDGLERFAKRSGLQTTPTTGEGHGFQLRFPQFPQPLALLADGDKLAFGLGVASAREALDPRSPLADTEPGKSAIESLGDGYEAQFLLVPEPLMALLEGFGLAEEEPDFAEVRSYVSAYRSIVAGTKQEGDRTSAKFVLNLQDPDSESSDTP
ncbi:MAG TPA: DUF3352 domain-containing protein [Conexibacter sp.]|nr:DUF3352 domain-containing protein [Conexibacter sp.]